MNLDVTSTPTPAPIPLTVPHSTSTPAQDPAKEVCTHCGLLPDVLTARQRGRMVCASPAMRALFTRVARFAKTDAPVVILGESGTGKEVVARALHVNSPRREQPFVAVNVAALPAELLESELFGHSRGAFTGAHQARKGLFESADGGVLFLDEIGEMPLALQAKLLRALQEGEIRRVGEASPKVVDVRVVCATHRDLAALVAGGQFREDLYYRLKVLTLTVAPLRQRAEDILPLARQFLANEEKTRARRFSRAAERVLQAYPWPGNVRELQNAVKYGAALAPAEEIAPEHLPDELQALALTEEAPPGIEDTGLALPVASACAAFVPVRSALDEVPAVNDDTTAPCCAAESNGSCRSPAGAFPHTRGASARTSPLAPLPSVSPLAGPLPTPSELAQPATLPIARSEGPAGARPDPRSLRTLAEVEREHILHVLEVCGGAMGEAAQVLGVARNTLWRKLKQFG